MIRKRSFRNFNPYPFSGSLVYSRQYERNRLTNQLRKPSEIGIRHLTSGLWIGSINVKIVRNKNQGISNGLKKSIMYSLFQLAFKIFNQKFNQACHSHQFIWGERIKAIFIQFLIITFHLAKF